MTQDQTQSELDSFLKRQYHREEIFLAQMMRHVAETHPRLIIEEVITEESVILRGSGSPVNFLGPVVQYIEKSNTARSVDIAIAQMKALDRFLFLNGSRTNIIHALVYDTTPTPLEARLKHFEKELLVDNEKEETTTTAVKVEAKADSDIIDNKPISDAHKFMVNGLSAHKVFASASMEEVYTLLDAHNIPYMEIKKKVSRLKKPRLIEEIWGKEVWMIVSGSAGEPVPVQVEENSNVTTQTVDEKVKAEEVIKVSAEKETPTEGEDASLAGNPLALKKFFFMPKSVYMTQHTLVMREDGDVVGEQFEQLTEVCGFTEEAYQDIASPIFKKKFPDLTQFVCNTSEEYVADLINILKSK